MATLVSNKIVFYDALYIRYVYSCPIDMCMYNMDAVYILYSSLYLIIFLVNIVNQFDTFERAPVI